MNWHPISELPKALYNASVYVWLDKPHTTMGTSASVCKMRRGKPFFINGLFAFDLPHVTHYAEIIPPTVKAPSAHDDDRIEF